MRTAFLISFARGTLGVGPLMHSRIPSRTHRCANIVHCRVPEFGSGTGTLPTATAELQSNGAAPSSSRVEQTRRQSTLAAAARAAAAAAASTGTSIPTLVGDADANSGDGSSSANQRSIDMARSFLAHACPEFLESHLSDDGDRSVKIGRRLADLLTLAEEEEEDGSEEDARREAEGKLEAGLTLLAEECSVLASGNVTVPTVRFGRTEIDMPILSFGCMRFQQAWGPRITSMADVTSECQDNLLSILRYAVKLGVNHIETARGYGCSELQLGEAFQTLYDSGEVKREDLIIQTKVPTRPTAAEFRELLERSFKELRLDYVDLLSVHGLNLDSQFDLLFDNGEDGNLIDVLREYVAGGKIRHLGFSTHGRPELIRRLIETDEFDYVNLHHHFVGSYTASGDGPTGGNLEIIRLMKEKDMGVFIISAFDKGGMLYAPSRKLRSLTLPDMEPIAFGSAFLWSHERFDAEHAPIHTISCGAARPSDLDQSAASAYMHGSRADDTARRVDAVRERLRSAEIEALGKDWVESWHVGLPNYLGSQTSVQHCNIVWLYNLMKSYGMLEFCRARYSSMENNLGKWDDNLSNEENINSIGVAWGWTPGCAIRPGTDYSADLSAVPEENKERVADALEFVHEWCSKQKNKETGKGIEQPLRGWERAYDMRPWTAFPERPQPQSN